MSDPAAELKAVLDELERREKRESFSADRLCFPPQRRAVESKATRKVLRCGRRAGKTLGIAIRLLLGAMEQPVVPLLYVTLTRANAKEILWPDLLKLNEEHGLGGTANLTELTLTLPNGCQIQLRGAHTEREVAKYRGKKFKLAVIDEAQSFPDRILSTLLKDVIGPTLLDYGGELWLVGTPPPVKAGIFWESYAGKLSKGREQHSWTVLENEKLPARVAGKSVDEILRSVREEYGWSEDDPTYRREYLGEDIEDRDSLLYAYDADRNGFDVLPHGRWTYVFGIDLGHDDSDAVAVLGWREHDRRVYLVEEYVQAKEDITDLAGAIKRLEAQYRPIHYVIDQGGLGKKIAVEIRQRHGIPVEPADKAQKPAYIKLLNTDLRKALLLARSDSRFAEDCKLVQRCPKAWARGELKERERKDGGYHSDICDSVLYGWRACLAHFEETEAEKPTETDKIDSWEQRQADLLQRRKGLDWWEQ